MKIIFFILLLCSLAYCDSVQKDTDTVTAVKSTLTTLIEYADNYVKGEDAIAYIDRLLKENYSAGIKQELLNHKTFIQKLINHKKHGKNYIGGITYPIWQE